MLVVRQGTTMLASVPMLGKAEMLVSVNVLNACNLGIC